MGKNAKSTKHRETRGFLATRRGRRQGAQPLSPTERRETPSARTRPGGPWPDIRLPPLPPTGSARFVFTPGSSPVHDYRCNLQCILRVVCKKHRFLRGFVAFAVSRSHLGDVKKRWVFHGFGSSEGVRNGKLDILTALVST